MEEFLRDLIKRAGKFLLANFRKDKELGKIRASSKEAVTKYDKILDNWIIKEIEKKYPTDSILTEESGFKKGNSRWLWIVDSLDGTSNFANSNPLFAICLAVARENQLEMGAIFAPAIDEFYFAKRGKGAYLNQKRIKVSKIANLKESYLVFCEGGEKNREKIAKVLRRIFPRVTDLRKIGSAGIEIGWVAAGRKEAYFTFDIDPWDVAAGVLLIEEAGGKVTDFQGNSWRLAKSHLLFSNKKIHHQLLNLLR